MVLILYQQAHHM